MTQRPIALGLALCEQVIVEQKTGNITLVNCFTERNAEQFPSDPIPFVTFAWLTNGAGRVRLEIVIERLDTFEEVQRVSFSGRFTSPLQTMRRTVRIRSCSFPVAGQYQVSLLAENELLAQRKLILLGPESSS
jgi:hypothetical protein